MMTLIGCYDAIEVWYMRLNAKYLCGGCHSEI